MRAIQTSPSTWCGAAPRLVTAATIAALALGSVTGCTSDGGTPAPTGAPSSPASSTGGSSPVTTRTPTSSASRSSSSPYHLDIPGEDKTELARWTGKPGRGNSVVSDELRAGRRYRLEGACIYGYGDQLDYNVYDARPGRPRIAILTTGTITCDGAVHTRSLTLKRAGPVQLAGGRMDAKTIGYLRVLR